MEISSVDTRNNGRKEHPAFVCFANFIFIAGLTTLVVWLIVDANKPEPLECNLPDNFMSESYGSKDDGVKLFNNTLYLKVPRSSNLTCWTSLETLIQEALSKTPK